MVIKKVNLDIVIGVTSQVPETDLPEVAFAGKVFLGSLLVIPHTVSKFTFLITIYFPPFIKSR